MPFDPSAAAARYRSLSSSPLTAPDGGWPTGAPAHEYTRSPAAARVGALAAREGLFLFHYEHAAHRELPEDWVPPDRSDLADAPRWDAGVLAERKYQSFRHDQAIGGFHPGHRAKWTTHELCHGLVGYAWKEGASPFFLATAGRLAELLPVVLWYFLDEACLRRCPVHERDGALFGAFCAACDAVAAPNPDDADAERRLADGKAFLERELAAVAKSRRLGRPIPHAWATLDLASDGVAYAGAHGARLRSEAFRRWADRFAVPGGNQWTSLDDLEGRVLAVAAALAGDVDPARLAPTRELGRARWTLQDLGWRLLTVWHDTGGDAADAVMKIVDGLGAAVGGTTRPDGDPLEADAAIARAVADYTALQDEWVLPSVEEVFGVGYELPFGQGSAVSSLAEGVRTATPLTVELLDDLHDPVATFAVADRAAPRREPIGERWARWLSETSEGALGDLARYEAALTSPPPGDAAAIALGPVGRDARVRLADGMRVLRFGYDVVAVAEGVDRGDVGRTEEGDLVGEDDAAVAPEPTALVVGRVGGGDLLVLDISLPAADAISSLGDGAVPPIPADEAQALVDLGVLVPASWPE